MNPAYFEKMHILKAVIDKIRGNLEIYSRFMMTSNQEVDAKIDKKLVPTVIL